MNTSLNNFQQRTLKIIAGLLEKDAVDDSLLEELWRNELDYFSLLEKNRVLSQKINIDEKTFLLKYNPGYLSEIIKNASRIMQNYENSSVNVSFVRFDIDDFSVFNNRYGHDLGDEVLIRICSLIKGSSRPTDYVIRFGGEEIDVILPYTGLEGAVVYIKKIFNEMDKIKFQHCGNADIEVTFSAGISTTVIPITRNYSEEMINTEYKNIQRMADDALYEAKYFGKNRYSIYSAEKSENYRAYRNKYSNAK